MTGSSTAFAASSFRVPGNYLATLVGKKAAAELCGADDPPDFMPSITFLKLCLEYMRAHDDESFGSARMAVPKGTFGILMAAAGQGRDFADALKRFAAAAALLRRDIHVRFTHTHRGLRLSFRHDGLRTARKELAVEAFAMTVHCGLRWLTGRPLRPLFVNVAGPVGTFKRSMLKGVLCCPTTAKGSGVTLFYRLANAQAKLAQVKYDTWAAHEFVEFMHLLEEAAASRGKPAEHDAVRIVAEVRTAIARGLRRETAVARQIGIGTATLRRRLSEVGCSFRELLDDVRHVQTAALLMTDRPLEDVAAEVGYSDVRSFRRVCWRWFGMTPGAYRRGMRTRAGR